MAQQYKIKGLSALNLKNGEKLEVEVEGIENGKVLLARVGNQTHALSSKCTHYGGRFLLLVYQILLISFPFTPRKSSRGFLPVISTL